MADERLARPFRRVDLASLVVGLVLIAGSMLVGTRAGFALGALGILIGTSTEVVSRGLEHFTGDEIRAAGDLDEDTGWLIGKLENVIVLALVLTGEWIALSIVFAAKSIVRREDISSRNTSYYLAGTLLNFTYAIAVGIATRWAFLVWFS